MTRRLGPLAALVAAFAIIGSCGREPTGLATSRGGLILAPRFADAFASAILDLGAIRVVLTRPVTDALVVDTVVPFPASADSIEIRVVVPIEQTSETFTLRMAITDTQGDTVFRVGPTDVIATDNPLIPPTEIPPPTYVGVGAGAAGVRFVSPPDFANFSQAVPIVAEAFDGVGDAIPGTPIGFELLTAADSTRARFVDRGVGSLTTFTTRGDVTVRAYLLTGPSVTHTVTVQPVANAIQMVSGNGQSATVGTAVAQPVVARVMAPDNLGVEGLAVDFRLTRGIDTLEVVRDTSDASGLVSFTPTLGTVAGAYGISATATVGGGSTAVVNFTASAVAGTPARLEFGVQPSDVLPSVTMAPAVTVIARDGFDNVVTAYTGSVTLALLDNPQGAVLAGTLTRAAVGGTATFNDLSLTGTGAGITLRATAAAVESDTSAAFAINAGTPERLEILQQPTNRFATQAFSPAIVVAVRDAGGNTVPTATDNVTIALLDNPTGAVLAGPTTVAAVNGEATFAGLSIAKAGAGYTLRVTSGALESDTSATFNVLIGPAVALGFYTQPPTAVVINTQMNVQVGAYDAGGNLVDNYGGTITVALAANPGGATLAGTLSWPAEFGIAAFGDLALDQVGVGYTLEATAAGLTAATSNAFEVTPPPNVITWINGAGGDWNTAANWSTGTVPSATDTAWVKLSGTYTVTVSVGTTLGRVEFGGASGVQTLSLVGGGVALSDSVLVGPNGSVTLSGGALSGAGTMQVAGDFTWSAGTLGGGGGSVRVLPAGNLTITGATARTLSGFTLELAGSGIWDGTAAIASGSGAVLRVLPSGSLDIQSSGGLFYDQGGTQSIFDVQGSVVRTVATDTVRVPGLTGAGVVGVSTGVFEARNSGFFAGTISIAPAGAVYFSSGTNTLTAASVVNGNGSVTIGGSATVSVAGSWGLSGLTRLEGGTFDFDAASGFTNDFEMVGGTKGGSGVFEVVNAMIWTGGNVSTGGGITRLLAGGTLVIDGAASRTLSNHVIEIAGSAIWAVGSRNISSGSAGTIRVLPTGTFDLQGGGGWFYDQGGAQSVFEVQGTVTRTVGTDTIRVPGLTVATGGSVIASSGVLEARNTATSSGSLEATAGGEIRFANGTQTMTAGALVAGDGVVSIGNGGTVSSLGGWAVTGTTRVNGGILDYDGALGSTTALEVTTGSKGGSGTLDVTGSFTWSGGNLAGGSGTTRVTGTGTAAITGTAVRTLSAHTLAIAGTGTWTGSFNMSSGSAATIRVLPGGSLDIQGDAGWFYDQGGAQSVLEVQGALIRSVSTNVAFVPGLSVSGTLNVSSGVLEARNDGSSSGTLTVGAGAELRFASGTHALTGTSLVNGAGLVHGSAGTINVAGGWAVTGTTRVSAGTMTHDAASGTTGVLQVVGGVKGGSGLLAVTGAMTWSGGNLANGGGITRVESGATLDIQAPTARTLSNHTLEIGGTGLWSGATSLSSGSGGTIRVLPTGSLDIQGDVQWFYDQGGAQSVFEVQGSATRTVSSGTAYVPGLAVSGTLTVSSGVLEARNAATSSGAFTATAPGELRFGSGNHTLDASSSVSGTGIVSFPAGGVVAAGGWTVSGTTRISGGSFDYNGALGTTQVLELISGVKGGSGVFQVDGPMTWSGGNVSGDGGTTRVAATGTLAISGGLGRVLNSHTLEILGTATWGSTFTLSSGSSGRLRVGPGGVLDIAAAPTIAYDQGGTPTTFENQGTINVAGPGATVVTANFEDAGAMTVAAGATFDLRGGGTLGGTSLALATGGTVRFGAGTYSLQPTLNVTGDGVALLDGATLSGLAAGDTARFARLQVNAGNLSPATGGVVQAAFFDWSGASSLSGGGTTYIPSGAVASFTGIAGRTLNNHTFAIAGSTAWVGNFAISSGSGAAIRVLDGGALTIQPPAATAASYQFNQGGGTSLFVVEPLGTVLLAADATFTLTAQLQHSGTTSQLLGTYNINGGGVLGGAMFLDTPAIFTVAGGTLTLADTLAVLGPGQSVLVGGTLNTATAADTAEFGRLRLDGGTVDPLGVILVSDHLEWAGGTSISGGTLVATDTLEITGTAGRTLNAATLETQGVTLWPTSAIISSGSVARIRNTATGDFSWSGDGDYLSNQGGGLSRLENEGILRFTGAGVTQVSAFVVDTTSNSIDIQSGTVELVGGGRLGGSATLQGILSVIGAPVSLKASTAVVGAGVLRIDGGTVALDTASLGAVSVSKLQLVTGQLQHEGDLTVTSAMTWSGGDLESNAVGTGGITRIVPTASLTVSGATAKNFSGAHTLDIQAGATAVFGGSGNINVGSGAVVQNAGLFDLSGTGSLLNNLGGSTPRFRNLSTGDLRRSGATAGVVMNLPIENAGGTLTADADTLRLTGGSVVAFTGTAVSESAPIKLLGNFTMTGDLDVTGTSGELVLASGNINPSGNTLTVGGNLTTIGTGTLVSNLAASVVDVGGDAVFGGSSYTSPTAGTLRIVGDFSQGADLGSGGFNATGTHTTAFVGGAVQAISFGNPALSGFAALELGTPSTEGRIDLLTDAKALIFRDTTVGLVDTVYSSVGALLSVGTAQAIFSTVFDEARLSLTGATAAHNIDGIRFQNMDVAATFLSIDRNATLSTTIGNADFATTPTTGFYVHARQVTNGAASSVVFTPPVTPTSPALFYNTTAAGGITTRTVVTWNGSPLPANP